MTFDYHSVPLRWPGQQIRLLSLHLTDDDDDGISGDLTVYDLADCPPYYGISYTWGDRSPKITIRVNGLPLKVQHNCWYALWQMRHHSQHNTFWIDQICIDQNNIGEKNSQVSMMGTIYRSATMVASCLGSGGTLATIRDFDFREGDTPTSVREALETLHRNPYFSRMWIKQEVILAREVRLFCGLAWLDWHTFEAVSRASIPAKLRSIKSASEAHPRSAKGVHINHMRLIEGRRQQQSPARVSGEQADQNPGDYLAPWEELWRLLTEYGDALCHDVHDKIYAMLPLVPDNLRSELDLLVDYHEPILTLALELVRNMLDGKRRLATGASSDIYMLPASQWETVLDSVSQWFGLSLSDPVVKGFAAQWSSPCRRPTLSNVEAMGFEKMIDTSAYAPMYVFHRHTIKDDAERPSEEAFDDDVSDFVFSAVGRVSNLSNIMSVKELKPYLRACVIDWHGADEYEGIFTEFQGRASLESLPSDLLVKVLWDYAEGLFLVPPETMVGDDMLICDYVDPNSARRFNYMPVVRRYDEQSNTPRSTPAKSAYSFLIGWALQIDHQGELHHRARNLIDIRLMAASDDLKFYLHYEDLMLLAMLSQEPKSTMTHPCVHPSHPSIFVEKLDETDHSTSQRDGPAQRGGKGVNFA